MVPQSGVTMLNNIVDNIEQLMSAHMSPYIIQYCFQQPYPWTGCIAIVCNDRLMQNNVKYSLERDKVWPLNKGHFNGIYIMKFSKLHQTPLNQGWPLNTGSPEI